MRILIATRRIKEGEMRHDDIVFFFRATLKLEEVPQRSESHHWGELLDKFDYRVVAEEYFTETRKHIGEIDTDYIYDYYWSVHLHTILFWRRAIRNLLSRYGALEYHLLTEGTSAIDSRVLGDDCSGKSGKAFNNWAINMILREELDRSGYRYMEAHLTAEQSRIHRLSPKGIKSKSINKLLTGIEDLLLRLPVKGSSRGLKGKRILLALQAPKNRRLIARLRQTGVILHHMQYHEIEDCIRGKRISDRFLLKDLFIEGQEDLTISALRNWLYCIECSDKSEEIELDLFLNKFSAIITDGEMMPVIRRLNENAKKRRDIKIFVLPEGGLDRQAGEFNYSWSKMARHDNLIRWHLSKDSESRERAQIGDAAARDIVYGYDTSLLLCKFYGKLLRKYLRLTGWKKTLIFFDYTYLTSDDFGVTRQCISQGKRYSNIRRALDTLRTCDASVITHSRQRNTFEKVAPNLPYRISGLHWSILASATDIVISTESSLILESLRLGKKVVIWHPNNDVDNVFKYIVHHSDSSWPLRFATSEKELSKGIEELMGLVEVSSEYEKFINSVRVNAGVACVRESI